MHTTALSRSALPPPYIYSISNDSTQFTTRLDSPISCHGVFFVTFGCMYVHHFIMYIHIRLLILWAISLDYPYLGSHTIRGIVLLVRCSDGYPDQVLLPGEAGCDTMVTVCWFSLRDLKWIFYLIIKVRYSVRYNAISIGHINRA